MNENNRPLALDAYEMLAERYAARADTKPHNAYYERPATRALLPPVAGLAVLDAGCGPGINTEWLLDQGATVVAVDASPTMVALARERVGNRIEVRVANLDQPLAFLADGTMDLVLCALVLDYMRDLAFTFGEFARVLKPGGRLVFSACHPFGGFGARRENYFATECIKEEWRGFGTPYVRVPQFRRPLSGMLTPLAEVGFLIERLVEPLPTEQFRQADPVDYEELSRRPGFLCVRAVKAPV